MTQPESDPGDDLGGREQRRRPEHERGRLGRFLGGFVVYGRTAWWGLVSVRVSERRELGLVQAVVLRPAAKADGNDAADEILLSMRSDLFGWELPGGTIEPGESQHEALLREVEEETGLRIEIERDVGRWTRTGFRPHVVTVMRCQVIDGELRPSPETPRVGWFDVDALPAALFPWYAAPIGRALLNDAESISVREFQGMEAIWAAIKIDLRTRWAGLP